MYPTVRNCTQLAISFSAFPRAGWQTRTKQCSFCFRDMLTALEQLNHGTVFAHKWQYPVTTSNSSFHGGKIIKICCVGFSNSWLLLNDFKIPSIDNDRA